MTFPNERTTSNRSPKSCARSCRKRETEIANYTGCCFNFSSEKAGGRIEYMKSNGKYHRNIWKNHKNPMVPSSDRTVIVTKIDYLREKRLKREMTVFKNPNSASLSLIRQTRKLKRRKK